MSQPPTAFMPAPWCAGQMTMDRKTWASLNVGEALEIVRSGHDVIAVVWADDDHDELATAHVIAAAPELLAFVQRIAKRDPVFAKGQDKVEIHEARALIDKALPQSGGAK